MNRQILEFSPFRLDVTDESLWCNSERTPLPAKEFTLLRYLVMNPGRLVTAGELFHAVWPGVRVSPGVLKVRIRQIRKALGDSAESPQFIESVRGKGYRFIAKVVSSQYAVDSGKKETRGWKIETCPTSSQAASLKRQGSDIVGREAELTRLHELFEKACTGERQLVFVTGEPGIGKTALVEEFLQSLASSAPPPTLEDHKSLLSEVQTLDPRHWRLDAGAWLGRGQCIEHYGSGEAYLPVLEALGRLCRTVGGERFIELLDQYAPTWLAQMPTLLHQTDLKELQRRLQGMTHERMLREMAEAIERLTSEKPLVLWLEDLHWADASTLELLAVLARRRETARFLVLGTYRPLEVLGKDRTFNSLIQELHAHEFCQELRLTPLGETDIAVYLEKRFSQSEIPTRLTRMLSQRTGGNPLFLNATVQDLIKQEVLVQSEGRWEVRADVGSLVLNIPESIRQLVARQRERLLPAEQQILEAASIAGLEFSSAAVAAALASEGGEIEERCALLAERQHFLRPAGIEEWPDGTVAARYGFLHALYQQLWHERVSVNRQQQWHLRIGLCKESAYGQQASDIAAELAIHFEQGRDYQKAIQYLQLAADNALRRSATREALAQASRGLTLLNTTPDTTERRQRELALQMTLAGALRMSKGFAAPEVAKAYARAHSLCRQVQDAPQLFSILWGLSSFYVARADVQGACEVGEQLLHLAKRQQDSALLVEAHTRYGLSLYLYGELDLALEYLEQGLKLYDVRQHGTLAFRYGQDPGVMGLCYTAIVLWSLGYPERARINLENGLRLAHELAHPNTLAYAFYVASALSVLRRDEEEARKHAEVLMTLATKHEFPYWHTRGSVYLGWALAIQGQLSEGINTLREGIDACQKTGAEMWQPYFRGLLADLYRGSGQPEKGLASIATALSMMNTTREQVSEAELWRLKGELVLRKGKSSAKKQFSPPASSHE